ncbi:MAG: hypothetical protein H0V17_03080 [Deltaproteobacteria bacterium]|nr:hypothetical protein [Deltaproteobacteria bacterium]
MRHQLSLLLFLVACAGSDAADDEAVDCADGKCDVLNSPKLKLCSAAADFKTTTGELKCTPCGDVLLDSSGRGFVPAFTSNDALIKKVYMTFIDENKNNKIDTAEITCPVDMPGIMAKLEKTDTKSCNGISTQVVSENAAKLGATKADYRAVTSRDCDGRGEFGLLFSSFGFSGATSAKGTGSHITEKEHPGEVEVIAFDEVDGVFNYYKEIGGKMQFFGSSIDFVAAGPGGPGLTNTRGCANCHPGGGINMKELESPWTHWSLEDNIAGADKLVESRVAYMGSLQSGANMQLSITQPGNDAWNKAKAKFLTTITTANLTKARTSLKDDNMSAAEKADIARRGLKRNLSATQQMLEPLFCTVQLNLNNAGGSSQIPSAMFASTRNGISVSGKSFTAAQLTTALTAIGSTVPEVGGNELTTPFMVLEPSHEDESYLNELVALKVLDQQLIQDVVMVDFTRPVLSDDRCALLAFVPDLAPADRKLTKIRDAIIKAVEAEEPAAGSPAAQLLAHLEATKSGKPVDHSATLTKYSEKCEARTAPTMLRDALKLRSLHRQLVFGADGKLDDADGVGLRPYAVFEFEATMPTDDVEVTTSAAADAVKEVRLGARFSPIDCQLVSEFVSVP